MQPPSTWCNHKESPTLKILATSIHTFQKQRKVISFPLSVHSSPHCLDVLLSTYNRFFVPSQNLQNASAGESHDPVFSFTTSLRSSTEHLMGAAGEARAGTKLNWAGINAHVQEGQNSLDDKISFHGDLQGMPRAVYIPESCPSLMGVHNKSSSACLDLSLLLTGAQPWAGGTARASG